MFFIFGLWSWPWETFHVLFGLLWHLHFCQLLLQCPNPFLGNSGNVLPDGIVAGSRKCKQAFSLNDPDNTELAHLATQAARKKAKMSKSNVLEKESTNQKSGLKSNHQLSIEEVEDVDNTRQCILPQDPKNVMESDDDDDSEADITEPIKKKGNLSKATSTLSQKK